MPIIRTVTKVRPSTDVEFKTFSSSIEHINSTYFDTRKQIGYKKKLSDDGLTLIVEREFVDQDALDEFESDPAFPKSTVSDFNKDNGIKVTKEIVILE